MSIKDMFFLNDLKALSLWFELEFGCDLWIRDLFPECIREIYASTPNNDRVMRATVGELAGDHVYELGKKNIFKVLIRQGGDFAVKNFEVPYISRAS
jgi:hypothetical protein